MGENFVILLPKQPKCKSEQMSLSQLQKWIVAVTIFSSFSVNCQCFLRGLSPVFRAMSSVASTLWKTSTLDINRNLPLWILVCWKVLNLHHYYNQSLLHIFGFLSWCYLMPKRDKTTLDKNVENKKILMPIFSRCFLFWFYNNNLLCVI